MEIRIVLVDMDGTLLGDDQVTISARNMAALRALRDRGFQVVPCTGRVAAMLPPQILAEPWIRYVVSCHGTSVYDRQARATLYRAALSPEASARVLRAFEGRGLYAEVAANHTVYVEEAAEALLACPPVPSHHVWFMCERRAYTAVRSLSAHFLREGLGVEKVNIYGIPEPLWQEVFGAVSATGLIRHTRGGAGPDLEFSPAAIDKEAALDALLRHLGADYAQVLAIGDSSTDADAIRRARIGVAMGNSPPEIRRIADAVTAPNTRDGFALAAERFLL